MENFRPSSPVKTHNEKPFHKGVSVDRYTFAKSSRLLKPVEFQKVRREGERFSTRRFNIFVLPNGLAHHRLGLSVSRRVGNAVVRNRVKRLLREFFRLRGRFGQGGRLEGGRLIQGGQLGQRGQKGALQPEGLSAGKPAPLFDRIDLPSDVLFVARNAEGLETLRDVEVDLATVRPAGRRGGSGRPGGTRSRDGR